MVELEPYIEEAVTRMYEEAEPPLDFQEVLDDPQSMDENWYEQHYLSGERQKEIVSEISEEHNLNSREEMNLSMEAILSNSARLAPRSTSQTSARRSGSSLSSEKLASLRTRSMTAMGSSGTDSEKRWPSTPTTIRLVASIIEVKNSE